MKLQEVSCLTIPNHNLKVMLFVKKTMKKSITRLHLFNKMIVFLNKTSMPLKYTFFLKKHSWKILVSRRHVFFAYEQEAVHWIYGRMTSKRIKTKVGSERIRRRKESFAKFCSFSTYFCQNNCEKEKTIIFPVDQDKT